MARKPRQIDELLAFELARGASIADTARTVGCSRRTVQRRLESPSFTAMVSELRRAATGAAAGRLAVATEDAVTCLVRLLHAESEAVRLGASRAILEHAIRFRESEEFERRLAALEELTKKD
jgi:AraC-like DNA-binding protein